MIILLLIEGEKKIQGAEVRQAYVTKPDHLEVRQKGQRSTLMKGKNNSFD
jgi:hypothetical protein